MSSKGNPRTPTLAIIIPAYNEEDVISRCLDSILLQTQVPDEIIVVNNNSVDRTAEIAGAYKNVTVLNEKKQGMASARNAGLNLSKCDLLARVDADCVLPPNWVEHAHQLMDPHAGELYGMSGPAWFYDLPSELTGKLLGELLTGAGYHGWSTINMTSPVFFGSNMVITQNAWQAVKEEVCGDETKYHEDLDVTAHLIHVNGKVRYSRKLVLFIDKRSLMEPARKKFKRFANWHHSLKHHRELQKQLKQEQKTVRRGAGRGN
jgi:glycosyltransferase involved in cell wall biosynthesis